MLPSKKATELPSFSFAGAKKKLFLTKNTRLVRQVLALQISSIDSGEL
jgi:hypothetical protein